MAIARLGGDMLNERLGAGRLLRGGMALVAIALGALLLVGEAVPAVVGFTLVRPRDRERASRCSSAPPGGIEPPSPSLAAAFTLGYTGFIVGPPVIGVLADQFGLPERCRCSSSPRSPWPSSAAARPLFQRLIDQH